jgi:molecular chaperone GrpE
MAAEGKTRRGGENWIDMQDNDASPLTERPGFEDQPGNQDEGGDAQAEGNGAPAGAALQDELEQAQDELARHREAMLRMQAEMENLHKRMLRDAEKSRKFALERIMKDLLQVRDSMERGLEVAGEAATVESLREGQELTLKMLAKLMQDHGLEVVDPAGQPFDPELHEAMTVMPSAEMPEDFVLEVLQKGFKLHDRLIRPARVIVSGKA